MFENIYFWIGLALSPFIVYCEWLILKKIISRPFKKREKIFAIAFLIFFMAIILFTVTGIIPS